MDITELKLKLCEITERFFTEATVIWAEQIATRPPVPYITLKTGRINRTAFRLETDDGRYYQADTILEINLYTDGLPAGNERDSIGNYINTAVGDLTDFLLFIESEGITDELSVDNITLQIMTPPTDVSQLEDDVHFRYRAMTELSVSFPILANGFYGIEDLPLLPNGSGGGTEDMIVGDYTLTDVEIDYEENTSQEE